MADGTKISWADATWSPLVGCEKVSRGCDHCYAIRTAHRMTANPNPLVSQAYAGTESGGEWTGKVNLLSDRLDQPLRWRKPRRIFVNAQSDLFHKDIAGDDWPSECDEGERNRRRPILMGLADYADALAAYHSPLLDAVVQKWADQ